MFLEKVFSIKNSPDRRHKIVNMCGIKIKLKYTRKITTTPKSGIFLNDLYTYYTQEDFKYDKNFSDIMSVTIIIPVYNGIEHLKKLVPSLLKNTPLHNNVKIIIINDCSTEPQISKYLEKNCKSENITIIHNDENLGFVKTINKAMSLVETKYAVWLNSDVVVPRFWLEKLLSPFKDYTKAATLTPFTNAGVYFSFPVFGQDNEPVKDIDTINKAFEHINSFDAALNRTYSGVGFCMAINMECWQEIGTLDEETFEKGYGEENDWCFRALQRGWGHYIVPNLYIQHFHGGSFDSKEKRMLIEKHLNILRERYPQEMNHTAPNFVKSDPWKIYRQLASILCCLNNPVLLIDLKQIANQKSGAIDYRKQLIKNLAQSGHDIILAEYERQKSNEWSIKNAILPSAPEIKLRTFADIKLLFEMLPLKKVIINNLAYLNDVEDTIYIICKLKNMFDFELTYKFHDHLSMCPSFSLINNNGLSCANSDMKNCNQECLNNNKYRSILRNDISAWRSSWRKLLEKSDQYHFFSEYTYNIVGQIYSIPKIKTSIIEHQPLFGDNYTKYSKPARTEQITIAFVGNFSVTKGAQYFVDLAELCKNAGLNYKFVVIGLNNFQETNNQINYICSYDRDLLGKILTENKVNAVVHPSIANETFSYLAQELMILNVPFVCFDNGAHAERIKKYQYPYAEISKDISAKGLYDALSKLITRIN